MKPAFLQPKKQKKHTYFHYVVIHSVYFTYWAPAIFIHSGVKIYKYYF